MPELPELIYARDYINNIGNRITFGGSVEKSAINKNCVIGWKCKQYSISSESRGKELMVILTNKAQKGPKLLKIMFHFGMSGVFKLTNVVDIPKHSHLRFFTINENPAQVLSFVDQRRYGNWKIANGWSADRGPDPITEYELFRQNIQDNLKSTVFNKPICEVLLNQKYFNGIGNYLRAEILYRAGIKPFEEARTVLQSLQTEEKEPAKMADFLQLCRDVPIEATKLDSTISIYDPDATKADFETFVNWIRCYDKPGMNSVMDKNKRTMWFCGEAGPLLPKNAVVKNKAPKPDQKPAITAEEDQKASSSKRKSTKSVSKPKKKSK